MIPLTTRYDDYIDGSKLSEKNPFEYIVPPPLKWVGTKIKFLFTDRKVKCKIKKSKLIFVILNLKKKQNSWLVLCLLSSFKNDFQRRTNESKKRGLIGIL